MDVRFLRGLAASYAAIATKDNKTFYYVTDEKKLYLGDVLLSNEVTLATFNALEGRVKALEDAGFQAQINAINETLKSVATNGAVEAIDNRLKAVEEDYLKGADKTELEGKITAHETAVNTKFADYSTTEQMNAAIDADVKVVTDYIAANEAKWSEKTDITSLEQRMTAVEGVADAAQTAQEVSNAIDAKITALDLANTYEAKGAAAKAIEDANLGQYTTEQEVKDIVDGVIAGAVDGDTITGLANLVEYINTHGGEAAEMGAAIDVLEGKVETIEGKPAYGITASQIENWDGEIGAKALAQGVKDVVDAGKASWDSALHAADLAPYAKTADISADIAKGVEAQGWGNHANAGYLKADDISGKEDKANLKALAYKDIAEKSDLAADVQASLALADSALQSHQDISHLATKQEVTDGLALKADKATYEAYVEAHKDDYNNGKIDELVAGATDKAQTAQNEVDALEKVVATNAETCTNNFNTISNQLTWGSF